MDRWFPGREGDLGTMDLYVWTEEYTCMQTAAWSRVSRERSLWRAREAWMQQNCSHAAKLTDQMVMKSGPHHLIQIWMRMTDHVDTEQRRSTNGEPSRSAISRRTWVRGMPRDHGAKRPQSIGAPIDSATKPIASSGFREENSTVFANSIHRLKGARRAPRTTVAAWSDAPKVCDAARNSSRFL